MRIDIVVSEGFEPAKTMWTLEAVVRGDDIIDVYAFGNPYCFEKRFPGDANAEQIIGSFFRQRSKWKRTI